MKSRADEFGHECMNRILKAKRDVENMGATFMAGSIAVICAEAFKEFTKRVKKPLNLMTDEEFIDFLESAEHLKGVDIQREIGKCQFWCRVNQHPPPTRRRIINWLNKAERAIGFDGTGKSSTKPAAPYGIPEPDGWKEYVRENYTDPSHADRNWATLPRDYQLHISKDMEKNIK